MLCIKSQTLNLPALQPHMYIREDLKEHSVHETKTILTSCYLSSEMKDNHLIFKKNVTY